MTRSKFVVLPATFNPGGSLAVTDAPSALAAAYAALRTIAGIPHAYHARGPAFIADEMQRVAVDAVRVIDAAVNAPAPAHDDDPGPDSDAIRRALDDDGSES